ncbi:hypothetical protein [Hypsugopox virus]|nr:hypothetical protein [Hypsugopox virus]
MDTLTTFRIKAYLDELSPLALKEFIHLFKFNTDFTYYDKDPSKEEIIYILQEEYSDCCIRLIYDIVNIITDGDVVANMIKDEHKNINELNYNSKQMLNYTSLDFIIDGIGIDDIIFSYFYWRRYKQGSPGKIFKEFMTYDDLALEYCKKQINVAIFDFNNGETYYKINIPNEINVDTLTLCKIAIGTIAILFDKVKHEYNFEDNFFNQISIFDRLYFKRYIKQKYK